MSDGGEIHWLLGIEIRRNRLLQTISLRQKHYVNNIVKRFSFENERTYVLPMGTDIKLWQLDDITTEQHQYMDKTPYMNIVGALRYAANSTQPDIAYVTGQLARHLQKFDNQHYLATKKVFQYLKGSSDTWLVLGGHGQSVSHGFCDSDGMVTVGNKAILGYVFQFGTGTVSWSSKRGDLVPFLTYKAEIQVLAHTTKEAIWIKHFTSEVLRINYNPIALYCDNMGTIKTVTAKEISFNAKTKHLDIRKNGVRDYIMKGFIDVKYVPTKEQCADMLTKQLQPNQHKLMMQLLGLITA